MRNYFLSFLYSKEVKTMISKNIFNDLDISIMPKNMQIMLINDAQYQKCKADVCNKYNLPNDVQTKSNFEAYKWLRSSTFFSANDDQIKWRNILANKLSIDPIEATQSALHDYMNLLYGSELETYVTAEETFEGIRAILASYFDAYYSYSEINMYGIPDLCSAYQFTQISDLDICKNKIYGKALYNFFTVFKYNCSISNQDIQMINMAIKDQRIKMQIKNDPRFEKNIYFSATYNFINFIEKSTKSKGFWYLRCY